MSEQIPDGWSTLSIDELLTENCLFSDGDWVENKDQDPSGPNRLIQLADVGDGKFLDRSNRFMNDEQFTRLDCTELKGGDILIARMPDPIGRACIFPEIKNRCATAVDIAILRPFNCDNYWLMSIINSDNFRKEIKKNTTGTTRIRIGKKALSKIKIASPPLPEQKKIAAILTSVDEVIENTQKQINKLQDLKKATMNELLTKGIGHTEFKDSELGRIPKSWEAQNLGDIAKFSGGSAFKEIFQGRISGTYPFIKVSDMSLTGNERYITKSANWISEKIRNQGKIKLFPHQATVFAKVGAALLLNRRRQLVRETAVDNNMMAAIPLCCNPDFLYFLLQTIDLKNFVQTGAVPSVNQSQMENIPIDTPSFAEQKEIASILTAMERQIDAQIQKLQQTQSLKKSLMQDLLTGRVRVNC